jgi:DNA-binding MarR family transcriptional regulator
MLSIGYQARLDESPLHLLHRLRQCAGELFHAEMNGIDLTARQYIVLVATSQKDGLSQQEIIEATGIDRSTISQVVQLMIRKGLLKRRRAKTDARAYSITLSEHGRDVLTAAEPIVRRIDEALISALPPERGAEFIDSLRTIIGTFAPRGP